MADLNNIGEAAKGLASKTAKKAGKAAQKAAKDAAINAADNKLKEKSSLYEKGRDAYDKVKKATKRFKKLRKFTGKVTKKFKSAGFKTFLKFIVSSPLGWFVGLVLLSGMVYVGQEMTKSISPVEQTTTYQELSDDELVALLAQNCKTDEKTDTSTGATDSASASNADWTVKGSDAYNNAKKVFDAWVSKGLSGASAAGIVGWVNSEGGFAMIGRAEGHYGNDIKTNSIRYGAVPKGLAYYTTEAGGGIYQFTPYTKYAPLNSPDWEDADKMNEFVGKAVSAGDWNASMDMSGKSRSFRQMAEETDPESATLAWQAYERGSVAHINVAQKKADARKAYELFDGAKYKFDAKKFESHFGSGNASGSGDAASRTTSADDVECPDDGLTGGNGWSEDGTGSVAYTDWRAWKPNELPADLKKYALDPESVGLKYGNGSSWWWAGDQCTHLAASLAYALWQDGDKHFSNQRGNGGEVVDNLAAQFGSKGKSYKPHAGSIFSSENGTIYGHVGIVSHVFQNGDILIIEQNYLGMSGASAPGEYSTYDYRYVTKAGMIKDHFRFYDPSAVGYKSNPKAKSRF